MITPDANVLLYALDEQQPMHERARDWLQTALSGGETVGFTWTVLLAVIRLSTRPTVFRQPLSIEQALDVVGDWLDQPGAVLLEPGGRHLAILSDLLVPVGGGGNLTSDAHVAAIAIEHGATLVSFDRDFARFGGLRWHMPD